MMARPPAKAALEYGALHRGITLPAGHSVFIAAGRLPAA
jgi:hypothetical protein